jgi:hypothetical protein
MLRFFKKATKAAKVEVPAAPVPTQVIEAKAPEKQEAAPVAEEMPVTEEKKVEAPVPAPVDHTEPDGDEVECPHCKKAFKLAVEDKKDEPEVKPGDKKEEAKPEEKPEEKVDEKKAQTPAIQKLTLADWSAATGYKAPQKCGFVQAAEAHLKQFTLTK